MTQEKFGLSVLKFCESVGLVSHHFVRSTLSKLFDTICTENVVKFLTEHPWRSAIFIKLQAFCSRSENVSVPIRAAFLY